MTQNAWIHSFLLEEKTFDSHNIYKRAVLRGQLSLLCLAVGIFYTFFDLANNLYVSIPYYLLLVILSGFVFFMNRVGRYTLANFVFLSILLFLLYAFADNDHSRTGVGTYLIIYSVIAIILFGYEQIRWGVAFSLLALACFFVAYFVELPPLIPWIEYTRFYVNLSFAINFIVSFITAIALLLFLLNINYKTEQDLLINNQLLTKTNGELDRFVYSASHDLRAPLTSLLGLIEICQRTSNPEEIQQCLGMMKVRISDLDVFIQEIIDYSRNTRQEVRAENFNLLDLVKEVAEGLRFGSGMDNIFVKYTIAPDLNVTSDRSRLKVILNNLIGNALKYSNPYREDQTLSVEAHKDQRQLIVKVEDNGIGIAQEHQAKIFEMFYRASEKSKGSGLGLYIVKETLDKLKGKIEVASKPGEGSVFRIEIPV